MQKLIKLKLWLTQCFNLLSRLAIGLISWIRANYRHRRFWLGLGLAALLAAGGAMAYRALYPPVLVSPDIYPFESVKEYRSFVENKPLITAEVPSGQTFTKTAQIRDDKQVIYTIELSQKPIKPQMDMAYVESYLSYLQNSQDEAKEWMRDLGQNPDELTIIWRPDPQEMRGKMLGETKAIPQKNITPTASPTPQPTAPADPRFPQ